MPDNHRSVIGDITHDLTNGEKQASWRERHLKNGNDTKLRAQFIFDASTVGRRSSGSPVTRVAR
jgi:hypothetical protein